jgi:dihydrofolate reductase
MNQLPKSVFSRTLQFEWTKLGLIDEYRIFVIPVILGAGTPDVQEP